MTGAKGIYERLRPLILWLGLTELAWISYWLLPAENTSGTFVGTIVAWLAFGTVCSTTDRATP